MYEVEYLTRERRKAISKATSEIKAAKGFTKAVQQLGKQLALRRLALNAIAKSHNAVYEVTLEGKIIFANLEQELYDYEIREWVAETNLKAELGCS